MLIFKLDFLGFYPTPTPKYVLKMLCLSYLLTQLSNFLKSSKVDFSIFRPQNLSKSEPMYAYKRYAYKKKHIEFSHVYQYS